MREQSIEVEGLLRDPTWRIRSATGMPSSACFSTATICSTEKRFFSTANSLAQRASVCRKLTLELVQNS